MSEREDIGTAPWPLYTVPLRLDVDGVDVAYRRQGAGEPVVYLHGGGLTGRWLPLFERLSRTVDLVVPEHPGFGDTPTAEWLRGFEDLVLHYDAFLDALGCADVHLVGHALGAWIAAEFAVYYPKRIKSLTLIAPMGVRVPGQPIADVFRMDESEVANALFNESGEAMRHYVSYGDSVETRLREYGESIAAARLMWNPRYDIRLDRRLRRVTCPSVVIGAEDDRIVPRAVVERYAELLPDATLSIVRGTEGRTGHGIVVQEPDQVAALVTELVGRVPDKEATR